MRSTTVKGLDYRFDVSGAKNNSFIDETYSKLLNISGQLNYRVNDELKVWIAGEHKEDKDRFFWGTPRVPAKFSRHCSDPRKRVRAVDPVLPWSR